MSRHYPAGRLNAVRSPIIARNARQLDARQIERP